MRASIMHMKHVMAFQKLDIFVYRKCVAHLKKYLPAPTFVKLTKMKPYRYNMYSTGEKLK